MENKLDITGTELIRQQWGLESMDEKGIQHYIADQIRSMTKIEKKIKTTQEEARKAQEKAAVAQGKIRAFHKKEAIEKLQEAVLAESVALGEIVECNICIFENQKAMAEVSKRLFFLGVGNMAMNRIVVKKISNYLVEKNSGESNSLMENELIGIVGELNAQLDLMQRVQNISEDMNIYDKTLTLVQHDVSLVQHDVSFLKKAFRKLERWLKWLK